MPGLQVIYKYLKDLNYNRRKPRKTIFSDHKGQLTPFLVVGSDRNSNSSIMHVLVTYKNEEDQFKNEGARVATIFHLCKSAMVSIPDAQGQLTPQS